MKGFFQEELDLSHLPCLPDEDFLRNGGCDFGCGSFALAPSDDGGGGGSGLPRPGAIIRGVGEGTRGGAVAAASSSAPFDFPPLPNDIPRFLKGFLNRIAFCTSVTSVRGRRFHGETNLFFCLDVCFTIGCPIQHFQTVSYRWFLRKNT